jgi:hypothetical protein
MNLNDDRFSWLFCVPGWIVLLMQAESSNEPHSPVVVVYGRWIPLKAESSREYYKMNGAGGCSCFCSVLERESKGVEIAYVSSYRV